MKESEKTINLVTSLPLPTLIITIHKESPTNCTTSEQLLMLFGIHLFPMSFNPIRTIISQRILLSFHFTLTIRNQSYFLQTNTQKNTNIFINLIDKKNS